MCITQVCLGADHKRDEGVVMMKKKKEDGKQAKADDAKICSLCGELIIGEYDYIRTRRHTEMYFHKGMKCRKGK